MRSRKKYADESLGAPPLADTPAPAQVIPFRTLVRTPAAVAYEPTDAELLARCRRSDSDAWDILVTRYERLVYSVAVRNGLDADDAADITQATFVSLIDSLDRLRNDERLGSWLMTVARRQSWRVRNRSRRQVTLDRVPEAVDDPFAAWDDVVALHGALGVLGGSCRRLLESLYLDARSPSYAEIAAGLGRSVGSIGPMRGRCLEKLRLILTEGDP